MYTYEDRCEEAGDAGSWAAQEQNDPATQELALEAKIERLRRFRETCVKQGLRRNVIAAEEKIAWLERELAERRQTQDVETCALCDGTGEVRIDGYDADDPPDYITCDACGGTGRIVSALERDAFDGIIDDMDGRKAMRDNALPYDEPRRRGAERMYR